MENQNKTVVIVGVLDKPGSTNLYMAKAFEKRGYNVIPVNYRTIMQNANPHTVIRVLDRLADDKPALILFSKCNGIDSAIIAKIGMKDTKTWFWFMDGIKTLSMVPDCMSHASLCTYSSFTGLGVLNYVKKKIGTGEGMYHIMEGVDPEVYRPTITFPEYLCDVAFIGTANPERIQHLKALAKVGLEVKAYGPGFNKEITGYEFNLVCAGAKMLLAISAEHNTQSYYSDRIFRYGACGAFVLHRLSPGMDRAFGHCKDVVYFNDIPSLVDTAVEYAKDERHEERASIARNLYNKVLANHTWDKVIEQICKFAEI
jgi:spore maturation protein CgeB